MKYNAWSRERIRQGRKFLTSRTKNHIKDPEVIDVFKLPWWFIKQFLYRGEGADSPEELQEVIDEIFKRTGKTVPGSREFFVHVINPQKVIEEYGL